MRFRVKPVEYRIINVVIIESGIATEIISVGLIFPRKINRSITARSPPIRSSLTVDFVTLFTGSP
jgi:hypothetical protein